ncbi:hypothetical protein Pelo_18819 [Pelomyxa schiedti]|nr:hypothetical protein Pelo_18819 [Pelomyxa schiedti]
MVSKLYQGLLLATESKEEGRYQSCASDVAKVRALLKVFNPVKSRYSILLKPRCDIFQNCSSNLREKLLHLEPTRLHIVCSGAYKQSSECSGQYHAEQKFIPILQAVRTVDALVAGSKRPCLGCYSAFCAKDLKSVLGGGDFQPGNLWMTALFSALDAVVGHGSPQNGKILQVMEQFCVQLRDKSVDLLHISKELAKYHSEYGQTLSKLFRALAIQHAGSRSHLDSPSDSPFNC